MATGSGKVADQWAPGAAADFSNTLHRYKHGEREVKFKQQVIYFADPASRAASRGWQRRTGLFKTLGPGVLPNVVSFALIDVGL